MRRLLILAIVACVWAKLGHARVQVYGSQESVWRDAFRTAPLKPRVVLNFGRAIQDAHPSTPAIDALVLQCFTAGEYLARVRPELSEMQRLDWHALALANLGRYWRLHGDLTQAAHLQQAALAEVSLPFARSELAVVQLLRACRFEPEDRTWRCSQLPTPATPPSL